MTRESVKRRLIRKLHERADATLEPGLRTYYTMRADELNARGSGALPYWAKDLAYRWGIE
jgi:hypothetical protein